MKKLLITICLLFINQTAFANYNDIYIADIQYDWINKAEVEKESIISEIRDIIFETEVVKQEGFKTQFKDRLKDKLYKEHYLAASAGYKEYKDYNISAFYYKKQKHIYMYAIQDKKDFSKIYYYDALGHLKYIDFIYGEYPDYPYYAIQYRISGKPVCATYYVSKDTQYLFEPDETFTGVWYKHNLYNKKSKIILQRTSY
ncbi:hypothetical protein IJD34_06900 [bacterium]|nr:hypothetical protein [bacterium]